MKRTPMRLLSIVLLGCAMAGNPARAAETTTTAELKISVAVGPALPLGKAAERWAALLNESANPRLAGKLHPGATLAGRDAAREFSTLQSGAADLAVGSSLQWSLQAPSLAVFCLPWMAPETRVLQALAANAPLRDALAARLDARGVVLVALAPLGYRELATSARAVRTPTDLNGLRLRAMPSPLVHDLLLALGALPQTMPFAQAQKALANGTLDGQEGSPTTLATARAAIGGIRHLTDWGAIADVMVFAVRKAVWSAWSDAERAIVRRAAQQAIVDAGALAREEAAVKQLASNGVAVVRITAAGHDAFRAAAGTVYARWRDAIGDDVVRLAETAVAAARKGP